MALITNPKVGPRSDKIRVVLAEISIVLKLGQMVQGQMLSGQMFQDSCQLMHVTLTTNVGPSFS